MDQGMLDRLDKLAFEASPTAKVIADEEGRIVRLNVQAERLFGYDPGELLGRTIEVLLPERFRDHHPSYRAEFQANREARQMGHGRDLFALRKDGSEFPVEVGLTPIVLNERHFALSVVLDLTERKKAEREKEEALQREHESRTAAEAANRLKDEFLATLSHELRTPLNAILGWAQMLETGQLDETSRMQAIRTIFRNAQSQAKLVEDILDVSRIITGKLRLETELIDLRPIVEQVIQSLRPAIDAKGISVGSIFDPSASRLIGDPSRLQQVVWNLISNAVKFSDQGGKISVKLGPAEKGWIEFAVRDTGRGIDPFFLPHLFQRFRQQDSSTTRSYQGLGLGLALVRHLIELHGGRVGAESEGENKGSLFRVFLPQRIPDWKGAAKAVPRQGERPLENLRMLVVDDDPDTIQIVRFALESAGATVLAALSAADAVEAFRRERYDAILSDISMPGEDGHSLVHRLRKLSGHAFLAVALSARAREEDRVEALRAGFDEHLTKPIEPDILVQNIAELLRRTDA